MKLSNKTKHLHELIAPAVAACGVDLWGIEFLPQGKRSLLRIYIDKTTQPPEPETDVGRGVGIDDCVLVTQQVGAVLDVHDPIAGEYALEVSSPGWDRPFFSLQQLQAYIGQSVAVRLISAVDNQRKFKAHLIAVDMDKQTLLLETEQHLHLTIDSDNIDKINLIYQDDVKQTHE